MKRGKCLRRPRVLAVLFLLTLLSAVGGCSSKPKPMEAGTQLPLSDQTSEVRTTKPYVLDVGDEVTISVWGFTDLAKTTMINNSGDIYFPLLGRLKLAGKTVPQAQELLTAKMSKYLVDPQVDFTTTKSRQEVFVLGEVNSAGKITYTRPMTAMEAIGQAKWFNTSANKSNVLLVRRAGGRHHVYRIDTNAVLKNQTKELQMLLQPGDLIYVPPTLIVDLARFMTNVQTIMQPFLTAEQMVILWPQFQEALQGKGQALSISSPAGGG